MTTKARFQYSDLLEFVTQLFEVQGLPRADAHRVAENLVLANLRGVDTHGVFRAPTYLKRINDGLNNPRPKIAIEKTAHCAALVNGDNGMGAVVGTTAMTKAIELAQTTGLSMVAVKHSTHFGMAAYYVLQALEAGLICMVFTNASPAFPPWGGRQPMFGTSPMAFGAPAGQERPFVLDMAMSVLARGNVYMAAQAGKSIPPGLALDQQGNPTTDPNDLLNGGVMLPFGGVKGAALSMLMDVFSGVYTGAAFAGQVGNPHNDFDRPQNVGHLFVCSRPDLFMPEQVFKDRMDELIREVKAGPKAAGVDEILIPGEREFNTQAHRLASGIELAAPVLEALNVQAQRLGVKPLI